MGGRKEKPFKKQQNHEEISVVDIPEDIRKDIVTRIPADVLWEKIRFVCKAWHEEISSSCFIYKHNALHQKSAGILIQPCGSNNIRKLKFSTYLLEMAEDKSYLKSNRFGQKGMGYILSSYNGLILEAVFDVDRSSVLHLKNRLTGFDITLPKCPSGCRHIPSACGLELGFNPNTNQYKLVHIYANGYGFELFTIGVDKAWRRVPGPIIEDRYFAWSVVVSVGGQFLHWFNREYIFSMDIWNEKFSETNLPDVGRTLSSWNNSILIEIDGKLSFVHTVSDFYIEIWVLKDFSRHVWFNEHIIDANCINYVTLKGSKKTDNKDQDRDLLPRFLNLRPVATLNNGEEIMFQHRNIDVMYLYDMERREMRKLKTNAKRADKFIRHHSSLVSL